MKEKTQYHLLIFSDIGQKSRTLGPSMIKHILKRKGYNTKIINFCDEITEQETIAVLEKYVTEHTVVGISTTYFQSNFFYIANEKEHTCIFLRVMEDMRKKMKFKILTGGPSASAYSHLINPDYVLDGYAENTIGPLMDKIFNNGISKNNFTWDIKNCDHIWDDNDHIISGEVLPLETSRGCIFRCSFCKFELIGKRRGEATRPLQFIKNELIHNYEKYNVKNYVIVDDTFNDDVYKMDQWNDMLSKLPFKINYVSYLRADLLHRFPHVATGLYETGLKGAVCGIETLNPKAAAAIKKGWSGRHAKDFMPHLYNNIFKQQVILQMNFIVGLPYETEESILETYEWIDKHEFYSCPVYPLHIRPVDSQYEGPTSEFDREYEKYGYRFTYPNDPDKWESPWMTLDQAKKIVSIRYDKYPSLINPWRIFILTNYGYSFDQARKLTMQDFYNNTRHNSDIFRQKYMSHLLGN